MLPELPCKSWSLRSPDSSGSRASGLPGMLVLMGFLGMNGSAGVLPLRYAPSVECVMSMTMTAGQPANGPAARSLVLGDLQGGEAKPASVLTPDESRVVGLSRRREGERAARRMSHQTGIGVPTILDTILRRSKGWWHAYKLPHAAGYRRR